MSNVKKGFCEISFCTSKDQVQWQRVCALYRLNTSLSGRTRFNWHLRRCRTGSEPIWMKLNIITYESFPRKIGNFSNSFVAVSSTGAKLARVSETICNVRPKVAKRWPKLPATLHLSSMYTKQKTDPLFCCECSLRSIVSWAGPLVESMCPNFFHVSTAKDRLNRFIE